MRKLTLQHGVFAAGAAGHGVSDGVLDGTAVLGATEVHVPAVVHDTIAEMAEALEQSNALAKLLELELELYEVLEAEASGVTSSGVGSSWIYAPAHHSQNILWARGTAVATDDTAPIWPAGICPRNCCYCWTTGCCLIEAVRNRFCCCVVSKR